ncbi:MAG: HEAT repeat domain-containing protein, partial [Gemmataceae bacterium]
MLIRQLRSPWAILLSLGVGTLVGCTNTQSILPGSGSTPSTTTTSRSQASDDFSDKLEKLAIGDKTVVSNTEAIPVSGVGLVWQLKGTGSPAGAPWREFLEKSLRKKGLKPQEFLDSPDNSCSLVLLSALIPPGARKNDPIDIQVTLPANSKTVSLQGGVLFECELYPYEQAGNVRDRLIQAGVSDASKAPVVEGGQMLLGQPLVRASGTLVVGTTDGSTAKLQSNAEETTGYRAGMIWSGGRFLEDRPYWFEVGDEKAKSSRLMGTIAARLNEAFPGVGAKSKTANAISDKVIFVQPPSAYRLNHSRFLLVSRQVPMVPMRAADPRRQKLDQELLEPATAIAAALKLEALGAESTPALRVGLENPSVWVRFASAESLAYLGNTAGSTELARIAENHPGLRSHCLTALATLDDGVSLDRLAELMQHPDAQLRYGAFVALRSANERHTALNGKSIRQNFWLHQVASDSPALVHLLSNRRNEIVIFGRPADVTGPFSIPLGTVFAVSRKAGDDAVTLSKVVEGKDGADTVQVKSKPSVGAMLAALGEMGGSYSEAVELVRRLDTAKLLPATLAIDATPRGLPITQLAVMAKSDPTVETTNLEVARASRGDVMQAGYDLPTESKSVTLLPTQLPELNKNPGRIFGGKKNPMEESEESVEPAP